MHGDVVETMETGVTKFKARFNELRTLEMKRTELFEEMLEMLEAAEARLAKTELDLEAEQNARQGLQQQLIEIKLRERLQEGREFVAVLLDADADDYVVWDNESVLGEGGC